MKSEAKKRADAAYAKRSIRTISVAFFPKDHDLYAWLKANGSSTLMRQLAREAMERENSNKDISEPK